MMTIFRSSQHLFGKFDLDSKSPCSCKGFFLFSVLMMENSGLKMLLWPH